MTSSSYHHGNLREALVEAAVEAARANGPDGIALRELARRVGVSHSAAYRHFSHRDEVVAEVALRGMSGLVDAIRRRLDLIEQIGAADLVLRARQRLVATGEAYVAFALGEPGLFRVAFAGQPAPGSGAVPASTADPYGMLSTVLDELVEVGFLSPSARIGAETTCWSAVHGFSLLHLDGPLAASDTTSRRASLDLVLGAIDRSYAASSGSQIDEADDIFARSGVNP